MQAVSFLCDGLRWGVEADHHDPDAQSNIFWVMQPLLDSMSFPDYVEAFPLLRDPSDINENHQGIAHSHVALILAIETGAINYVQQHPDTPTLAQSKTRACKCLPLLYHATALPFLGGKMAL